MNTVLRLFAILLVVSAFLSGQFPGSESRCSYTTGAAFAQAQEPGIATPTTPETSLPASTPADATSASIIGTATSEAVSASVSTVPAPGPLPKLIDLGADKCIPCKKMAPILEEAEKLYKGRAEIVFIDVWKNREEGAKYGIRTIPTQIFFDASGTEVLRHEGFFPMEEIQKQFKAMGVELKKE